MWDAAAARELAEEIGSHAAIVELGRGEYEDESVRTIVRLYVAHDDGPFTFDDGEVIEWSQEGFESKPFHRALAELGGREVGDTDHMVTETLIRGMYEYWRKVMEA